MKRPVFLLVVAIASFAFGAMLFFAPTLAAQLLAIGLTPETASLLRGMGGLIIGSGTINLLLRNSHAGEVLKAVLITNIVTHAFGLGADIWGIFDGALTIAKMAPVEITHLFCGIGSGIYLARLNGMVKI